MSVAREQSAQRATPEGPAWSEGSGTRQSSVSGLPLPDQREESQALAESFSW